MALAELARCWESSNAKPELSHELNAERPAPIHPSAPPQAMKPIAFFGTHYSLVRCSHTFRTMEATMLKGGLLWLIGIPLPIILILYFMGWLS
jgi:hypothetical protein